MKNWKDIITNWLALAVLIAEAVNVVIINVINGQPFNWLMLVSALLGAFILWATGKAANLKSKTPDQLK